MALKILPYLLKCFPQAGEVYKVESLCILSLLLYSGSRIRQLSVQGIVLLVNPVVTTVQAL